MLTAGYDQTLLDCSDIELVSGNPHLPVTRNSSYRCYGSTCSAVAFNAVVTTLGCRRFNYTYVDGVFAGVYNTSVTVDVSASDSPYNTQSNVTYQARILDDTPGFTANTDSMTLFDDGVTPSFTRLFSAYLASGVVRATVNHTDGLTDVYPNLTYHDATRSRYGYNTIWAKALPGLTVPRTEYLYITVSDADTTASGWSGVNVTVPVYVIASPVYCSAYHTETGCPVGWGVYNASYDCVTNCTVADCCYQCGDGFYSPGNASDCVYANCSVDYPNSRDTNQTNASTVDEACECLDGFGPQPSIQCTQQPCYEFLATYDTCAAGTEPAADTFTYVCVGNCTTDLCCDACTPGSYKSLSGNVGCTFANCTSYANAEATGTVGATSVSEACACLTGYSGDPAYDNCTNTLTNQTCAEFLTTGGGVCGVGTEPAADAFTATCVGNCTTALCCDSCLAGAYKAAEGNVACTETNCDAIAGAEPTNTTGSTAFADACVCSSGYTGLPLYGNCTNTLTNQTCLHYLSTTGVCNAGNEPEPTLFTEVCINNCTHDNCCTPCEAGYLKTSAGNTYCVSASCGSISGAKSAGSTGSSSVAEACQCLTGYTGAPEHDNCTAPSPNQTCVSYLASPGCPAGYTPTTDSLFTVCVGNCSDSDCCNPCAVGFLKAAAGNDDCQLTDCAAYTGTRATANTGGVTVDDVCECVGEYTGLPSTGCVQQKTYGCSAGDRVGGQTQPRAVVYLASGAVALYALIGLTASLVNVFDPYSTGKPPKQFLLVGVAIFVPMMVAATLLMEGYAGRDTMGGTSTRFVLCTAWVALLVGTYIGTMVNSLLLLGHVMVAGAWIAVSVTFMYGHSVGYQVAAGFICAGAFQAALPVSQELALSLGWTTTARVAVVSLAALVSVGLVCTLVLYTSVPC